MGAHAVIVLIVIVVVVTGGSGSTAGSYKSYDGRAILEISRDSRIERLPVNPADLQQLRLRPPDRRTPPP
jgi:hypothetical protein